MISQLKLSAKKSDFNEIYLLADIFSSHQTFATEMYVSPIALISVAEELRKTEFAIPGVAFDFQLGKFGQEYAGGAMKCCLHARGSGLVFLTTWLEMPFSLELDRLVANRTVHYSKIHLGALDRFVQELDDLGHELADKAELIFS